MPSEGLLYPPFLGLAYNFGIFAPQTLREWKTETDVYLATINIHTKIDELAHLYGLGPLTIAHEGSVFEIKTSPTSGTHAGMYRIERYSCILRNRSCIRNVTDPCALKGHVFAPLSLLAGGLQHDVGGAEVCFRGKTIVSNLGTLLSDPVALARMQRTAVDVSRADWVFNEEGFLFIVDVAGFGQLCSYVTSDQGNIFEDGAAITERFRYGIAEVFEEVLIASHCVQSYFTGDGLIAAIPLRLMGDQLAESARAFFQAYGSLIKYLAGITERLPEGAAAVGSRMVVQYGAYEFGRIGGPTTAGATFSGDSIVELARAEAALSGLKKKGDISFEHIVGFTPSARTRLGEGIRDIVNVDEFNEFETQMKERHLKIFAGPLRR